MSCLECGAAVEADPNIARAAGAARLCAGMLLATALLFLGGASLLSARPTDELGMAWLAGGLGVVYLSLAWWARRRPLPGSAAGLLAFLALVVGQAVKSPEAAGDGLAVQGLFLLILLGSLAAALEHRRASAAAARD